MVTINDIAKLTGFSKSTVSRALNNNQRISQETRDKINQVAKELDYMPNSNAVSLSTGKKRSLGVIVPYPTFNSYYDHIMNAIIYETFNSHYKVNFLPSNYDKELELTYLKMLQTKEFDGLIITSATNEYTKIAEYLQYGMIVSCENTGNSGVPSVVIKRANAYRKSIELLENKNIETIGVCISRTLATSQGSRMLVQLFNEHSYNLTNERVYIECRTYKDGLKAGEYFSKLTPTIEAIYANSDEIAAGIIKYYQDNQLKLPYIIGQDNEAIGEFLGIPTIDLKLTELGIEAVKLCLSGEYENRVIHSELMVRD